MKVNGRERHAESTLDLLCREAQVPESALPRKRTSHVRRFQAASALSSCENRTGRISLVVTPSGTTTKFHGRRYR
jgi:hypothetical protein